MPDYLVDLALREFETYEAAKSASPNGNDCVKYDIAFYPSTTKPFPTVRLMQRVRQERRAMSIQQLPSGMWGWVPEHPDDLAVVAKIKSGVSRLTR